PDHGPGQGAGLGLRVALLLLPRKVPDTPPVRVEIVPVPGHTAARRAETRVLTLRLEDLAAARTGSGIRCHLPMLRVTHLPQARPLPGSSLQVPRAFSRWRHPVRSGGPRVAPRV